MAPLVAIGLAACTSPNPDFLPPATGCMAGVRSCSGERPVVCEATGSTTELVNAQCPSQGGCAQGHCTPPMSSLPCTRELDCAADETCTPFVAQSGALENFCTAADGITAGTLPCSAAAQCRSDLCLSVPSLGREVCYLACTHDGDCPPAHHCRTFTVTITGIQGTIQGCSPK